MNEYKVKFLGQMIRSASSRCFRFKMDEPINFVPGQFAQIIFDSKDRQNKNLNKYLSFSCKPGRDYIEFTKKITESEFSQKLLSLKEGDCLLLRGPMGKCTLNDNDKNICFIVGGIGITPVISILESLVNQGEVSRDVRLIYSNWTKDDISFKTELDKWEQENSWLNVEHIIVECDDNDDYCYRGMITKDLLLRLVPDIKNRSSFLLGPPGMIKTMQAICEEIGLPKDKIKTESFLGY